MTTKTRPLRHHADAARAARGEYYSPQEARAKARALRGLPRKARLAIITARRFRRAHPYGSNVYAENARRINEIAQSYTALRFLGWPDEHARQAIAEDMHDAAQTLRLYIA